jgi:hypothetical protein
MSDSFWTALRTASLLVKPSEDEAAGRVAEVRDALDLLDLLPWLPTSALWTLSVDLDRVIGCSLLEMRLASALAAR